MPSLYTHLNFENATFEQSLANTTDPSNPERWHSSSRCQAIWGSKLALCRLLGKFNETGDVTDLYETGQQPDEKTVTIIVYQLKPITNSTRVSQYVVCKNFIAVSETAQISATDHDIWFANKWNAFPSHLSTREPQIAWQRLLLCHRSGFDGSVVFARDCSNVAFSKFKCV